MSSEDKRKLEAEQAKWLQQQTLLEQKQVEQENLKTQLQKWQDQLKQQHQQLMAQQEQLNIRQQQVEERWRNSTVLESSQVQSPNTVQAVSTPSVSFFSTIGSLSEFSIGEDWELYEERLNQYFVANSVPEDRKVAVLITLIGQEAYKVLKNLCDPCLPSTKPYSELCDILNKQFAPRVSVFKERIEFYHLTQSEFEKVNEWYARIESKAITCKFGSLLDDKIKDKFVTGLKRGPVLDRVCELESTATLNTILEAARNKEATLTTAAKSSSLELHKIYSNNSRSIPKKVVQYNKDIKKKSASQTHEGQSSELKCRYCGGVKHSFARCKYKSYRCKNCKKVGHLSKVCKEKRSDNNFIEINENCLEEVYDMLRINSDVELIEPEMVEILIKGTPIMMEIDSGAGKSVIPERFYKEFFSHCILEETTVKLRMYDGTVMLPIGQIVVKLCKNGTEAKGSLVVVKDGCRPLMGRDLMKVLGFYIASINAVEEDKEVKALLVQYSCLFESKLGKYEFEKVQVKLKDKVKPIFIKPRAVPLALKKKLDNELDKLEAQGVITLKSNGSWGTPLVPILKSEGNIRLCADYKITVNPSVEDVKHPLPRIEELFAALSGGEKFTKLDLTAAYNQLELTEDSKELLAWSTHRGIYYVNRLPFGVKPACAIFQKIMEKVLLGAKGVINFLDDIVVTGTDKKDHLANLKEVFKRLSNAGFKLNFKKCSFMLSEIKYLGHIIDKNRLKRDPEKVAAIVNVGRPADVQEVKAFVGMVNYYAKFVPKISEILAPLYELLKTQVFDWSEKCEKAFRQIKKEMSSERFLIHFNPSLEIKLVCDASKVGIGAVLLHILPDGSEKPISYASRVLRSAEKNYSVIHREALAIYWAVNKFYQYLLGNEFILCSDHKPLQALFGENKGIPQLAAGRLQRWALFLSGFNYKFQYVKGECNGGADGLSRLPLQVQQGQVDVGDYFHFLVEDRVPVSADEIKKELRRDRILSKVYLYTRDGWPDCTSEEFKPFVVRANEISLEDGIVMWGYRVIVPEKLRSILLEEIHSTHMGIVKMKALARQYFWWPNLDKDIETYAKNCSACMSLAKAPGKAALIKFREATFPFERIHIDFLGPFEGKEFLLVIDAYSKWPEIFEMNKKTSTNTIEKLKECFARFGLPGLIISDNGLQLTSEEFNNFCKSNFIAHETSAPYHPSTNGLAENAVGSFKRGIKRALLENKNKSIKLSTLISRYLFSYRNIPHSTTGETPAKLMLGRNVKTRLNFLNMKTPENVEDVLWKRHVDQLLKTGRFYERQLEEIVYEEGEMRRRLEDLEKGNLPDSNNRKVELTNLSFVEGATTVDLQEKEKVVKENLNKRHPGCVSNNIKSNRTAAKNVRKTYLKKDLDLNVNQREKRTGRSVMYYIGTIGTHE
ncbi:uncharacterized protein K02A2.6-like [Diprion similis]|uniref:uncharacterized protein K02A2.6-like n=1 Tax=Diprion similis TaxID=362088 RepID=UPI001EF870A1|nr:uncharacterized protein K02A2.6-like [Diprion similis]